MTTRKILPKEPVPSNIEIAQSLEPIEIKKIAKEAGILPSELELYGKYKAKIQLSILNRLQNIKNGRYVHVTSITPTILGEGETTTTVGLSQALGAHLNKKVFTCIRQTSLGATLGIKGNAAGGGYSQIIPIEDFNLHLTGDIHAITVANNLLAAAIDSRLFHEATQNDEQLFNSLCPILENGTRSFSEIMLKRLQKLGINKSSPNELTKKERSHFVRLDIDPKSITWKRVTEVSDQFLRNVTIKSGKRGKQIERNTTFDITPASEIMSILALSTGLKDMQERLGQIVIGNSRNGDPITANDLGVTGALSILMREAIKPNLMQTIEGTPVFVHTTPFSNIAHGNSSIIADYMALKLVGPKGYVVTESGFGADMGMEKFFNIKCRYSNLTPNAIVLVATIRGLKMHGGAPRITAKKPLPEVYNEENLPLLEIGCNNLVKHIQNIIQFGVPVIVAINQFQQDTKSEIDLVKKIALRSGAYDAVTSTTWSKGGYGAIKLAKAVIKASKKPNDFKPLYDLNISIKEKIEAIATKIYGASGVKYSYQAEEKIKSYNNLGFNKLPICMAKTQLSLSNNPKLRGTPKKFSILVKDIRANIGAGFLVPILGNITTMPSLPIRPAFYDINLDLKTGKIKEGFF